MNEKDLNIKYIQDNTGLVDNDELIPIILEMMEESYKAGLCQSEIDNTMGLIEENEKLKKQLEYLRSGEYYNQLRFENEMLQQVVDTNGVPSEVYDFIDCTHRNTELLEQQQEFIKYLEEEKDRLAGEISAIYENDLGKTKLVNEDIYNEVVKIELKYKEIMRLENE